MLNKKITRTFVVIMLIYTDFCHLQEFLNRLVRDHGSIDLEWLREVEPDKAK